MNFFASKNKSVKAKKSSSDSRSQELRELAKATLGSPNLKLAVQLPEGEDLNEWLAACVCDAFNQLHMLYGTVTEFCTPAECPVMNAGPKYEYLWSDGQQYKKPTKVSAPVYVDLLMNWVQMQLDDEAIFPSSANGTFPKTFVATVKKIVGRLFRVYGHIYHSHLGRVMDLNELQHLNTSFKHFVLFVREFDLMDPKEQAPLKDVMEAMSIA